MAYLLKILSFCFLSGATKFIVEIKILHLQEMKKFESFYVKRAKALKVDVEKVNSKIESKTSSPASILALCSEALN